MLSNDTFDKEIRRLVLGIADISRGNNWPRAE